MPESQTPPEQAQQQQSQRLSRPVGQFAPNFEEEDPVMVERMKRMMEQPRMDRREEVQQRMSEKEVCRRCGSNWFREETFNQYRAGTYSSSPGGALEILNAMPMTIPVCICGYPTMPLVGGAIHGGRTPNENIQSFDGSMQAALQFLEQSTRSQASETQALIQSVVSQALAEVASRRDLEELRETFLGTLDKAEEVIEEPVSPAAESIADSVPLDDVQHSPAGKKRK